MLTNSVVMGTGSYLPQTVITNEYFQRYAFYQKDGVPMQKSSEAISNKVQQISGIKERRYCLLYTSPSPRDRTRSRMPSSA